MTFSIGFRAPTQLELLDAFMQTLTERDAGQQRYRDPGLQVPEDDLLIDTAALHRFKQSMISAIEQSDKWVMDAVGRLLTETKPSLQWHAETFISEPPDETVLMEKMLAGDKLVRNPYIRLAWAECERGMQIFAAGESVWLQRTASDALPLLCGKQPIALGELKRLRGHSEALDALFQLIGLGAWYWDEEQL
jgi:50S ribosomal protein L16 3-hydroxylase